MEDVLGLRPSLLKRGFFLFPLSTNHHISFTATRDVARVAIELLRQSRVLNSTLDVIELTTRTLAEVANLPGQVLGRKVVASGNCPWLPLLRMAQQLFRRFNPVMAS